jgi:hypothetical protein
MSWKRILKDNGYRTFTHEDEGKKEKTIDNLNEARVEADRLASDPHTIGNYYVVYADEGFSSAGYKIVQDTFGHNTILHTGEGS